MLILSRHLGETIVIGNDITISVLGVQGKQVRLGINAPKDTSVHRLEIYKRIHDQKKLELEEENTEKTE